MRVEGEKKHFKSLTIREKGEGNLVMQRRGKGDVVRVRGLRWIFRESRC